MPTAPTQMRLTPDDLAAIQRIRFKKKVPSMVDATRLAIHYYDAVLREEKKKPKKSAVPT